MILRTTLGLLVAIAGMATACVRPADEMDPVARNGERIDLSGTPVTLRVELWRDVQPGAEANPLLAVVTIAAESEDSLQDVAVEQVTLSYGSESWAGSEVEMLQLGPSARQFAVRGAPRWPAGARVEVTVGLRTETGLQSIRLSEVPVQAVE